MALGYYACPWHDCRVSFDDHSLLGDHLDTHLETFLPIKLQDLPQWRMTHMGGPTPTLGVVISIQAFSLRL